MHQKKRAKIKELSLLMIRWKVRRHFRTAIVQYNTSSDAHIQRVVSRKLHDHVAFLQNKFRQSCIFRAEEIDGSFRVFKLVQHFGPIVQFHPNQTTIVRDVFQEFIKVIVVKQGNPRPGFHHIGRLFFVFTVHRKNVRSPQNIGRTPKGSDVVMCFAPKNSDSTISFRIVGDHGAKKEKRQKN